MMILNIESEENYVLMEQELHNKGQGDLLDGKMKIKAESVRLHHKENGEIREEEKRISGKNYPIRGKNYGLDS